MVWQFRRIKRIIFICIVIINNPALGMNAQTEDQDNRSSHQKTTTKANIKQSNNLSNDFDLISPDNLNVESLDHDLNINYPNNSIDNNNLALAITENTKATNPTPPKNNLVKEEIPLTHQEQAKVYYDQGVTALEQNQEIEATTAFKKSLLEDPKYHKARIQLIKLYQKIGWNDENERLLIEGLELAPEHSDFIKNLGILYQQKGQMRKSLSVLLTMPEYATNQIDYLALLALAYLNADQPDLAINYYKQLSKINKDNPLWYLGLAISQGAKGNAHEAITNFNIAKNIGRFNPETLDYINHKIKLLKSYE